VHGDDGDIWHFDGGRSTRALGLTAAAGLSDLEIQPTGRRYATTRPASWDPKARLQEMELDGIYAQVLYPSITLTGAAHYSADPVHTTNGCATSVPAATGVSSASGSCRCAVSTLRSPSSSGSRRTACAG
jgi:hypothetical protein